MRRGIPEGAPGHPRKSDPRTNPPHLTPLPRHRERRGTAEPDGPLAPARDSSSRGQPGESGRRGRPARGDSPLSGRAPVRQVPRILYEDEEIIAVDKPSGMPVIAADGSRARSLYDFITRHIRMSNPKGRAAVVHRIDRDTSGLVIFARSAATKRSLMGDWDRIVRERVYAAVVEGEMDEPSGRRESWLMENRGGTVYEVPAGTRGAKRAATRWQVRAHGSGRSLLELRLETGRKHQIRVQLAALGHPVAGDERYGARTDPLGRLALHAELIELVLPGRREALTIRCPVPPAFRAACEERVSRLPAAAPAAKRNGHPRHGDR